MKIQCTEKEHKEIWDEAEQDGRFHPLTCLLLDARREIDKLKKQLTVIAGIRAEGITTILTKPLTENLMEISGNALKKTSLEAKIETLEWVWNRFEYRGEWPHPDHTMDDIDEYKLELQQELELTNK